MYTLTHRFCKCPKVYIIHTLCNQTFHSYSTMAPVSHYVSKVYCTCETSDREFYTCPRVCNWKHILFVKDKPSVKINPVSLLLKLTHFLTGGEMRIFGIFQWGWNSETAANKNLENLANTSQHLLTHLHNTYSTVLTWETQPKEP